MGASNTAGWLSDSSTGQQMTNFKISQSINDMTSVVQVGASNMSILSLCEKCPNMGLFLVRIFLYLDWIQENTDQK